MYVDAHSIHLIQPHHLHVCCKIERGLVSWFEDRSGMLCVMYVGVWVCVVFRVVCRHVSVYVSS